MESFAYFNSSARFWDLRYLKLKNYHTTDENPHKYLINKYILKSEIKKFGCNEKSKYNRCFEI